MATHAHTTPIATARKRHVRFAPGALDRRHPAPSTIRVQLPRTEGDGLWLVIDWNDGYATLPGHPALPVHFNWTGAITSDLRHRIENDVDLLIALLDALDAPAQNLEHDNEDCCEAADDDPASSATHRQDCTAAFGPGDPADGESTPEDEGEEQVDDMPAWLRLPTNALLPSRERCSNGPFQLDSTTYAAVRGWATAAGRRA